MITVIMEINKKISNILLQIKFYLDRVTKHDWFCYVCFLSDKAGVKTDTSEGYE